ncbi:MAG TPA: DUF6057 family protein [Prolixibacteraceae bacterium]|nr:DUF6057 family protein [Prolixibacteraceae bacterium]
MKIFSIDKLLSLVFGFAVFLFFAILYPFHLNYQEQYQLFLFTPEYFLQFMAKPGGFSDYLGHFFTQFFFYSWVGAIIIATILIILQRAVWYISRQLGAKPMFAPLTFIPSLLYWGLLCDENYLFGGVVVMLLVAAFVYAYTLFNSILLRISYLLVSIPILYWLSGGAFLLLPLFAVSWELIRRELKNTHWIILGFGSILLSLAVPILSKSYLLQYPMSQVWIGANYFRFPVTIPFSVGVVGILIIIIPFVLHFLSARTNTNKTTLIIIIQLFVLLVGGYMFISRSADLGKEEIMAYDFNVRMRKWDRVIELADKKSPSSPLSVTCLNLALAKEGLLAERMFNYYQNGVGGLIPDFVRDYTIPMVVGEVYYHLGFINTAQRYAFEAMEALPDYQKSVRSVKRLAETNLINGKYAVAGKYLHLLQETFYYRKWATKTLNLMKDEKLIDQHPEFGWLRQCRTNKDFLFSEREKDMMLGILFTQNNQNQMAYEYLMAYTLLSKDLKHFYQYFPLGKSLNYQAIPKSYQETLTLIWGMTNNDPTQDNPYPVSAETKKRFQAFRKISSQSNPEPSLRAKFSDSYWYYLNFRNN